MRSPAGTRLVRVRVRVKVRVRDRDRARASWVRVRVRVRVSPAGTRVMQAAVMKDDLPVPGGPCTTVTALSRPTSAARCPGLSLGSGLGLALGLG